MRGGDALPRFIQYGFRLICRFQTGECELELDSEQDDPNGSGNEYLGVTSRGLEVNGFFPEKDRVGTCSRAFRRIRFLALMSCSSSAAASSRT